MFTRISIHHAMSLVFTGISIHHAMSLTKTGVKIISENKIILITDGRLHKSIFSNFESMGGYIDLCNRPSVISIISFSLIINISMSHLPSHSGLYSNGTSPYIQ